MEVMSERLDSSRREQVISLRKNGLTYAEIGRKLDLTRERVRQVVRSETTRKKKRAHKHSGTLLTTAEAAALLHVHPNTVRHWSNRGILETYRIGPRGDRRFRRRDVDNFLLKKSPAGTS